MLALMLDHKIDLGQVHMKSGLCVKCMNSYANNRPIRIFKSIYQGRAVPGAGQEPLLTRVVHRGQDVDRDEGREVGRQEADGNSLGHRRHEGELGL